MGEIERRIILLIEVLKLVSDFEEGLVKIIFTLLQCVRANRGKFPWIELLLSLFPTRYS